jgi:gamma-glutamyl phosphate reductase
MNNDINEQFLNRLYEDLHKEQMRIVANIKNNSDMKNEKENQKQFTILNTLMINTLRLKNIKKQILEKRNL